jgi:hypothetical protein
LLFVFRFPGGRSTVIISLQCGSSILETMLAKAFSVFRTACGVSRCRSERSLSGCRWLSLAVAGCRWLSLAVAGCRWLSLAVAFFARFDAVVFVVFFGMGSCRLGLAILP